MPEEKDMPTMRSDPRIGANQPSGKHLKKETKGNTAPLPNGPVLDEEPVDRTDVDKTSDEFLAIARLTPVEPETTPREVVDAYAGEESVTRQGPALSADTYDSNDPITLQG